MSAPSTLVNPINPSLGPAKALENLSDRFVKLTQHNIKFVILTGHLGLPFQFGTDPIYMLFEPSPVSSKIMTQESLDGYRGRDKAIVDILALTPVDPLNLIYSVTAGNKSHPIMLIPKGIGMYPMPFETRIINSRMKYNDVIAIPSPTEHVLALMYHRVHRQEWLKDEPAFKDLVIQYLNQAIGPATTCQIPMFQTGVR